MNFHAERFFERLLERFTNILICIVNFCRRSLEFLFQSMMRFKATFKRTFKSHKRAYEAKQFNLTKLVVWLIACPISIPYRTLKIKVKAVLRVAFLYRKLDFVIH